MQSILHQRKLNFSSAFVNSLATIKALNSACQIKRSWWLHTITNPSKIPLNREGYQGLIGNEKANECAIRGLFLDEAMVVETNKTDDTTWWFAIDIYWILYLSGHANELRL